MNGKMKRISGEKEAVKQFQGDEKCGVMPHGGG